MKAKKLITILLAVLLLTSACVVTAMGYNKTFSGGYSYSAKDSKGYAKMEYRHNTSVNAVNTFAQNLTSSTLTADIIVYTIKKITDSRVDQGEAKRSLSAGTKSGVGATDYRSKSTNVYYYHKIETSKGTTIVKTVG